MRMGITGSALYIAYVNPAGADPRPAALKHVGRLPRKIRLADKVWHRMESVAD